MADEKAFIDAPESLDYGIDLRETLNGFALHIVNYNFNGQTHKIDPLPALTFGLNDPRLQSQSPLFPGKSGN